MFKSFRTTLLAGAACVAIGSLPARAADVTPAQAAMVESQLRTWMTGLLGPAVTISDRPVQLTPAGDHFDAVIPIVVRTDGAPSTIRMTATARPLENGKWSIESIRTAMPVRFTVDMPQPPKDGQTDLPTLPVTYSINLAGQDGTIVLDPTFATPSTYTSSAKGGTIRAEGGPLTQETRLGAISSVTTIRPAGPDRVDIATDGTAQDYEIATTPAGVGPINIAMKMVRVNMGITGISRSRATTMTQNLATVMGAVFAAKPGAPPKVAPEVIAALLGALQDFASEMNLDETIEGLAVSASGVNGLLAKAKIGFGAKSDAGLLQARMDLGMEGLSLPGLDLGPLTDLIPTEVTLRPFVSGVGVAELMRIISASSEKREPAPADIAALFSHGGIVTGLENLSIEMAGATFTGQGKVTFLSPERFSGAGQITAEDFDDLIAKVSAVPQAAQAVPVLVIAKGLGRTVNDKLVWNISYADGKFLVNNVDVMKMAAGGQAAPGGPQKGPPANRPNPNRR